MYDVYDLALAQSATLGDRFVIMDCHGDNAATLRVAATGIGNNNLQYGAAYHPFLKTSKNYVYSLTAITITHKVNADRSADGSFEANGDMNTETVAAQNSEVQSLVKAEIDKFRITLPPCSSIAGVYAKVDLTRGVWKAPANVSLNEVNGLTKNLTDEENGNLNIDPNGKSINAIRIFTGRGILVWGARTLAGNDNEWRYVPVRRLFNMVEESCKKASGQFVFEPNDANTWTKVRAMISNFLTVLWRQGALAGSKPEQAFYVACGLGTTMTALDILEGRMIVEIGMAAVRPAEFIILRFSHKMQEA
jgi:phage tail sheath protein FI